MSEHSDLGQLDDQSWNRLQEILERFEKDCSKSFPRDIIEYVPPAGEPLRHIVLCELVRTDLELRWSKRQGVLVEFYLKDFPELIKSDSLPSLLRDEMQVRLQHAARPELIEYQQRFPDHFENLAQLVEGLAGLEKKTEKPAPAAVRSDFVVPVEKDSISDTMSGVFAMAARFKRIRKLGEGAFGEVWEAQGPGGVPVAIKRIFGTVSPKAVERERESLDLICSGKLRHPFLLQVFGWWINNDRLHIMMELADESLDDRLKAANAAGLPGLTMASLKQILIDAADALDFLNHERNIVHRDVKPANMLLMANRLKLCDFGLSRMSENLDLFMGRTRGAGTPVFMAPEIIRGYQSAQSDQYSLANSYFMLRTGKPIFRGKVAEIRQQHLSEIPNLDTGVLNPIEQRVLHRALAKNTAERFPTCGEFICELIEASEKGSVSSGVTEFVQAPVSEKPAVASSSPPVEKPAPKQSPQPRERRPVMVPTLNSVPRGAGETAGHQSPFETENVDHADESEVPMTIDRASRPAGFLQVASHRRWEPLKTASSSTFPRVIRRPPSPSNAVTFRRIAFAFLGTAFVTAVFIFILQLLGVFSHS